MPNIAIKQPLKALTCFCDRMNGAVIKGYEKDVGNRTSVYVHTSHSITTSLYLFRKYGYKSAPHDEVLKLRHHNTMLVVVSMKHKKWMLIFCSFLQGIKYVMIPEGMRDYVWLKGLLSGEKASKKGSISSHFFTFIFNFKRIYSTQYKFVSVNYSWISFAKSFLLGFYIQQESKQIHFSNKIRIKKSIVLPELCPFTVQ